MGRIEKRLLIFLLLIVLLMSGCQGVLFGLKGRKISDGYRIPLVGEKQTTGTYRTLNVTIRYRYFRGDDALRISGVVHFNKGIENSYRTMRYFHLGLLLADAEGTVLEARGLKSIGSRTLDSRFSFNNNLQLPLQTSSIVFTYTGQAAEGGGSNSRDPNGGGDTEFWHYPIVK
jgi:hypothetical protein